MDSSKIILKNKYILDEKNIKGITINHFKVNEINEKKIKRIKGDYFNVKFDYVTLIKKTNIIKKEIIKILKDLLKENKINKPLIIGLGNQNIICDSLGTETTNKIMVTNHFTDFLNLPKVAIFNPSITEKTGISSFDLIEMVVHKLKPTVIILIDSLCTNNKDYLNNSIEINNTGLIPGSAIKDNKKIDSKTFNIPLIAIGVPLILEEDKSLYTTPNVKEIVNNTSRIIRDFLNDLFF